ncbi:MAG: kelch repeat-containing protein, partial [Isosphaeraceae bacterium]
MRRCQTRTLALDQLEQRALLAPLAWSFGSNLPTARGGVAAVLTANQSVAVIAGPTTDVPDFLASDPAWTTSVGVEPGRLDLSRMSPGVGTLSNGSILVFGGVHGPFATSLASVYDPTGTATHQVAPLSTPRSSLGYATDANHHVYAIGGMNPSGVTLASGEWYNQSTNRWTAIASLPQALSGLSSVADNSGHILAIGGYDSSGALSSSVYEYTIATNSWSTLATLPVATADSAAVFGSNGLVYVIGGVNAQGTTASVYSYDETTNQWTTATSLPSPVSSEAAAVDSLGRVVVAGGFDAQGNPVSSIWISQRLNQPDAAPVFTTPPPTVIPNAGTYSYQVFTTANPQATYSLVSGPQGATIDSATGLLTWTPTSDELGTQSFTIQASNYAGNTLQSFSLNLTAPQITTTSLSLAAAGIPYTAQIQTTGNPAPVFSLTAAPSGMTIDPNTGVLSWTPAAGNVGNNTVTVQVSSVVGQSSQGFTLPVQGLAPTGLTAT